MAKFSITGVLGIDSKGMTKGLSGASAKMAGFAKAGAAAALAVAAAMTAFGIKSVKAMIDFDKKMKEVFTLMPGITGPEMKKMEKQVYKHQVSLVI